MICSANQWDIGMDKLAYALNKSHGGEIKLKVQGLKIEQASFLDKLSNIKKSNSGFYSLLVFLKHMM